MRVVIRVDATPAIGSGHLMRCLTLADALRAHGATVEFLTAPVSSAWIKGIWERGFSVVNAPDGMCTGGVEDIRWSRHCLAGPECQWVVVDHYGIDAEWERAVPPAGARVLVIDDLANRAHACDVLLDQNYLPDRAREYQQWTSPGTRLLLGPSYALVAEDYVRYRALVHRERHVVRRVLVFFGGADPWGLTERALEALSLPGCEDLEVDVVVGADATRRESVERLAAERRHTRVFGPRRHLADLMADADVALGAGGSTTWERLCLGLAGLVVTVAANQEHVARALAGDDLIVLLGQCESVTAEDMAAALRRLRQGQGWPDVAQGMRVCDGAGAVRVVEAMQVITG